MKKKFADPKNCFIFAALFYHSQKSTHMSNELDEVSEEELNKTGEEETVLLTDATKTPADAENKEEEAAKKTEENEEKPKKKDKDKVKKKNAIPDKLAALANLGIDVAKAWAINHPTFTVKFTDYQTLLLQAQTFSDELSQSQSLDGQKTTNTDALKDINQRLATALRMLKNYIKAEFDNPNAVKAAYISYGLIALVGNSYGFPRDNDLRQKCLLKIVAKLQEPANLFAGKPYGLAAWEILQTDHEIIWEGSKTSRMGKSSVSNTTDTSRKDLRNILSKLRQQIKVDFDGQNENKILRTFAFMKENV